MQTIQQITKNTEITELNSNKNSEFLLIDDINQEPKINAKDIVWFSDIIYAIFGEDCTDKEQQHYLKAQTLMEIVRELGMSQKAFRRMVIDFIANHEYPTWRPANVTKYGKQPKLYNEDWYKHQLATTELNPEHFELFLVDGKQFYCYKMDANKIIQSDKVRIYRPKQIKKDIIEEEIIIQSDEDKILTTLTKRILELEAINENLNHKLFLETGKTNNSSVLKNEQKGV